MSRRHVHWFPLLLLAFATISLAATPGKPVADHPLRVMTYNLRYDNPGDSLDNWKYRRIGIASFIAFEKPDLFGIQEGLDHMLIQLDSSLATVAPYQRVGVGRDDGKRAGEYSAIYFNSRRFQLLSEGHFWLSDTTDRPAFGWDAACIRIATWVKLLDRENDQRLFVVNTHFDHVGVIARQRSAALIRSKITQLARGEAVLLMGDFNSTESDAGYATITNPAAFPLLRDSRICSQTPPLGPLGTFSGFDPARWTEEQRIDFIFVSPEWNVLRYAAHTPYAARRHFLSDHLPVLIDLTLKR